MHLSELLAVATGSDIGKGDIAGICVVCGAETECGIPLKKVVSDNFTGWNCFFAGNCTCPECAFIFSDQTFRRKSWVASSSGFKTFKNDEACSILFSPPDPPFFIHIAKLGQKQTWLRCLHNVANSTNKYWFSHEGYDIPILFEKDKAVSYLDTALSALGLGITKTELRTGEFKLKTWREAYEKGYQDFLRSIRSLKNNLLWEVIVDVARR
jgi:hypothetical protein